MDGIACTECRTRKLRDRPDCTYCVKHKISCTYHPKVVRSPISRAKLNSLEHRAKCLERALLAAKPDADVTAITSGDASDSCGPSLQNLQTATRNAEKGRTESHVGIETPDQLPPTSSGFEWDEGTSPDARPADGMGTLSFPDHGVGYIGNLAAAALLRVLRDTGTKLDSVFERLQEPLEQNVDPGLDSLTSCYMVDQFISAYFHDFHTFYPLLHEPTFRAQVSAIIPKPELASWGLLFKVVLATGAWCMNFPNPGGGVQALLNAADAIPNSLLLGSGSLCTVQALTLMSLHLQRLDRPNIAYVYHGAAVRMAISLGLTREFPGWKISPLDREIRRRLWWCLYLFDSGQSITLGRPVLLPSPQMMDVRLPLNIHDTMLTMATSEHPTGVEEPTIYSHIIAQVGFQLVFNPIYDRLINRCSITPEEALKFDGQISTWESSLPFFLRESAEAAFSYHNVNSSRYRLNWRVRSLRILVFFPAFLRWVRPNKQVEWDRATDNERQVILRCLDYVHQNVCSIQNYFLHEPGNILGEWYAVYFLSQAGLISILAGKWSLEILPDQHQTIIADIKTIKQVVGTMSARNEQARKFLILMELLMPDSSLDNDNLMYNLDGSEFDESFLNAHNEASFAQADEWARFFWPAPS